MIFPPSKNPTTVKLFSCEIIAAGCFVKCVVGLVNLNLEQFQVEARSHSPRNMM